MPSRCGLYFFAAGFLAAVSLVAAAAAALTLTRYSALYNRAQEAKPLLAEASRLLRSIDVAGLQHLLEDVNRSLPALREAVEEYGRLYRVLEEYRPMVIMFYNETHSRDFNETLRSLQEEARHVVIRSILGPAIARALEDLADLLRHAQRLSSLALQAYRLAEKLPPSEAERFVKEAETVAAALRGVNLAPLVANTTRLLEEANSTLSSLPPPRPLAAALAAASLASLAGSLVLLRLARGGDRGGA